MYSFMPSGSSIYGFSVQMVLLYFLCQITCFASKRLGQKKKKTRTFSHRKGFSPTTFWMSCYFCDRSESLLALWTLLSHFSPHLYIMNSSQQETSRSAIITFPQQHLSTSDLHTSHALFTSWWVKSTSNEPLANKWRPKPAETAAPGNTDITAPLETCDARECDTVSNSLSPLWLQ